MSILRTFWSVILESVSLGKFFSVKWFFYLEEREIKRRFPFFRPWNDALKKMYLFSNPFHISKRFLKKKGAKDLHQYGETPLPALAKIAEECALTAEDHVVELGCGRGRGCFFLRRMIGCSVRGIDWIPEFIENAKEIQRRLQDPALSFECGDMLDADLRGASVIYLFGTCLEDETIVAMLKKISELPCETKTISVSYPLSDYDPSFETLKEFSVCFPWGEADIYLNRKSLYT